MSLRPTLQEVVTRILALGLDHPTRVGIDGFTAAGKSTFADDLAAVLIGKVPQVLRVSMDDFHHPSAHRHRQGRSSARGYYDDAFDHESAARVLLDPAGPDGSGRVVTGVWDLAADAPLDPVEVELDPFAVVVVDGTFLQRPPLTWDLVVYLDVDPDVCLRRALVRDLAAMGSEEAVRTAYRERYHAACTMYALEHEPRERADVLIDNTDPLAPVMLRG